MTRSKWNLLLTVAVGFLLVDQPIAGASEPAVDRANFRWSTGYSFEKQEELVADFFFFRIAVPELEAHTIGTAGILVLPLTHSSGARIRVGALGSYVKSDSSTSFSFFFFPDDSFWIWQVDTAADLFLRDSDVGHIDIGYRFAHQESRTGRRSTTESHSFAASVGVFTEGFGILPADLETRFRYSRVSTNDFLSSGFDEFTLAGFLRLHPHQRLRVDLGPQWRFSEAHNFFGDRHDVRGVAEILWLLPLSRADDRNYITFNLFGTGGQVTRESQFFGDLEQDVFSVGFGLTVLFAPVDSLIQYTRHRS